MKSYLHDGSFIDEAKIDAVLAAAKPDPVHTADVLAKARECVGLDAAEMAQLMTINTPEELHKLYSTAKEVKELIYGKRIVLFAPLYVSNICGNECVYCAFRSGNKSLIRKSLTIPEVESEVRFLVNKGHKRLLIVAGEAYDSAHTMQYIYDCIKAAYSVKTPQGEIRRINVNIAPQSVETFQDLAKTGIGTFQVFQETYNRATYKQMHVRGRKADYDWRVTAPHRAMEAGISDVGIGPLLGLHDWRWELQAMLMHIRSLEQCYGVGPHTISIPRMEPAHGSDVATNPPAPVSDEDFLKLVAIIRLTVPYTGMIMSTRESSAIRMKTLELGISQISAGSRTDPGGYQAGEEANEFGTAQFQLGDHRQIDEIVRELAQHGFIPSFCTACYRLGRTGLDFMDLARPGEIKNHCTPNAISTCQEFLQDYASPETRAAGEKAIQTIVDSLQGLAKARAIDMWNQVKSGKHDVIC